MSIHDSPSPAFATTRWSQVMAGAGGEETTVANNALEELCRVYWYPLYAFVRRSGHTPHDAQDLTQEFFARLLEKRWLSGVSREKGRFRSFLLASMKHFLANEWDRSLAQKRGGGAVVLSLDADAAEARFAHEPADPVSADQLYDRRWALDLLDRVLERLKTEFAAAGKAAQFEALRFSLTGDKVPLAEVAQKLVLTEGAAKVAVHRLRERYRDLIRAEIAQTVSSWGQVEQELEDLFAALRSG